MFEKDQLIMCGGHGVCRVVNVTGNPFDRFDKVRRFYVLEPVFEKASTVYMPVDNEKVVMRRVMNREEAEELIDNMTEIETVWIKEEKGREQMYKDAIRTYDCQSLVQIIKTLYLRRQNRINAGKKALSSDEQYLRKAEALLYSEMSVALDIPKEEVQEAETRELINRVYDGSADKLFAALLSRRKLSAQEIERLKQMVGELE